jgi:hypothetical protein
LQEKVCALVVLKNFDRILLAAYLVALWALLLSPVPGMGFRFLDVGADKWMHFALFGGLAVVLCWNLSRIPQSTWLAVFIAFVVAVATEIAQGLIAFRSADVWDLLAGLFGAVVGAVCMGRILQSSAPKKMAGVQLAIMGLVLGTLCVAADVIAVGTSSVFGTIQLAGTVLGAVVAVGGVWIYRSALVAERRYSDL